MSRFVNCHSLKVEVLSGFQLIKILKAYFESKCPLNEYVRKLKIIFFFLSYSCTTLHRKSHQSLELGTLAYENITCFCNSKLL